MNSTRPLVVKNYGFVVRSYLLSEKVRHEPSTINNTGCSADGVEKQPNQIDFNTTHNAQPKGAASNERKRIAEVLARMSHDSCLDIF